MIKALLLFAVSAVWVALPILVVHALVFFRFIAPAYQILEESMGRWVFPIVGLSLGWMAAYFTGNNTPAIIVCVFVFGQVPGLFWAIGTYQWLDKHYSYR